MILEAGAVARRPWLDDSGWFTRTRAAFPG
jgi:hypothetical protein